MKLLPLALLSLTVITSSTALAAEPVPLSQDGLAQSDEDDGGDDDGGEESLDDVLGEILGSQDREQSVSEEREAVESGDTDNIVGANAEEVLLPDQARNKRIIKTIQKKNFLKLGRFEASPAVAFVTNDPFLNRYIGNVGLGYHATEIFEIEANVGFSPNLHDGDWKSLTTQLVENNHVSPDLSPLVFFGSGSFVFSPIYGKVAVGHRIINFDIYGAFGMGFVLTQDDLEALQQEEDEYAIATANQIHPTTNFGGGLRVILGESLALRLEGRSLVYIETVSSTTLEMKNNFLLQLSASLFFPNMKH
ncbi:MAG: outer membrane beta-barrel domain-containing protein [Pseudomonadota bacterium]